MHAVVTIEQAATLYFHQSPAPIWPTTGHDSFACDMNQELSFSMPRSSPYPLQFTRDAGQTRRHKKKTDLP